MIGPIASIKRVFKTSGSGRCFNYLKGSAHQANFFAGWELRSANFWSVFRKLGKIIRTNWQRLLVLSEQSQFNKLGVWLNVRPDYLRGLDLRLNPWWPKVLRRNSLGISGLNAGD